MNLIDRVFSALRNIRAQRRPGTPSSTAPALSANSRTYFRLLKAYYLNNALYDDVAYALRKAGVWNEALKPIRNPASRVVEFYPATLWPGSLDDGLPVSDASDALKDAIHQVFTWSNWAIKKQTMARWLPLYGNVFIKAAQRFDGRPYLQLIEPEYINSFDADERGFLTFCRIDTPQIRQMGDKAVQYTRTEVWDKDTMEMRIYEHERDDAPLDQIGDPILIQPFETMGIDFVPVVHAPFRDIGEKWGAGVFAQQIDKIDEANRMATRLHQMLFRNNKNTWAITAGGVDDKGRPLPAPKVGGSTSVDAEQQGKVSIGDDEIFYLPGNSDMKSLVPNLQYAAALSILNAMMAELESDLPELLFYRIKEFGQTSGVAIRRILSGAVSRAEEGRGNGEAAIIRAVQMALTMGANAGIFQNIGAYDAGDFDFTFKRRPVLPADPTEMLQDLQLKQSFGVPDRQLQMEAGYTEEDFKQWDKWKADEPPNPLQAAGAAARLLGGQPVDEGDATALLNR
jgi:hypothetical protein